MSQVFYPSKFKFVSMDALVAPMRNICDMQIHAVLSFNGFLEFQRLKKALYLLVETEPILGCRLQEGYWRSSWQRRDDLDDIELCTLIETDEPETELQQMLITPIDEAVEPLLQLRLFRAKADLLCIKVSHLVADAGGVKECLYTLAFYYNRLATTPDFFPEPNLRGDRSVFQILRRFGWLERLKILRRNLRNHLDRLALSGVWHFPEKEGATPTKKRVIFRHIDPLQFDAIKRFGRCYQATLNDILVAAYARALYPLIQPTPGTLLMLMGTVDLRRYLPNHRASAICNLSSTIPIKIGLELGEDLVATTKKVSQTMNALKADLIGLGDLAVSPYLHSLLPAVFTQNFLSAIFKRVVHFFPPSMTNLGRIEPEKLQFAKIEVERAFLTPPIVFPGAFTGGVSGFGNSITFAFGFCEGAIEATEVEALLDRVLRELPDPIEFIM